MNRFRKKSIARAKEKPDICKMEGCTVKNLLHYVKTYLKEITYAVQNADLKCDRRDAFKKLGFTDNHIEIIASKSDVLNSKLVLPCEQQVEFWLSIEEHIQEIIRVIYTCSYHIGIPQLSASVIIKLLYPSVAIETHMPNGQTHNPYRFNRMLFNTGSTDGSTSRKCNSTLCTKLPCVVRKIDEATKTPSELSSVVREESKLQQENYHSSKAGCFPSPPSATASPGSRKSIWAQIKEATQKFLSFSEKVEEQKPCKNVDIPHEKGNKYVTEKLTRPNECSELPVPQDSVSAKKTESDKMFQSTHQTPIKPIESEGNEQLVKKYVPLEQKINECNEVKIQSIGNVMENGNIQEQFQKIVDGHTSLIRHLNSWSELEVWLRNNGAYQEAIVDCLGFPTIGDGIPRLISTCFIEFFIKAYSSLPKYIEPDDSEEELELQDWQNMSPHDVVSNEAYLPQELLDFIKDSKFDFTETTLHCEVRFSNSVTKNRSLHLPAGLKILSERMVHDRKRAEKEESIILAVRLICKSLNAKTAGGHTEARKFFCENVPKVCVQVGKSLTALGKSAQMVFMNLNSTYILAEFDHVLADVKSRVSGASSSGNKPIIDDLIDDGLLLCFLLVLKTHVVNCYDGLWNSSPMCLRTYSRITKLLIHSFCNTQNLSPTAEIPFEDFWSHLKDELLNAFILDACENIVLSNHWKTIKRIILSGREPNPEDEKNLLKLVSFTCCGCWDKQPNKATTSKNRFFRRKPVTTVENASHTSKVQKLPKTKCQTTGADGDRLSEKQSESTKQQEPPRPDNLTDAVKPLDQSIKGKSLVESSDKRIKEQLADAGKTQETLGTGSQSATACERKPSAVKMQEPSEMMKQEAESNVKHSEAGSSLGDSGIQTELIGVKKTEIKSEPEKLQECSGTVKHNADPASKKASDRISDSSKQPSPPDAENQRHVPEDLKTNISAEGVNLLQEVLGVFSSTSGKKNHTAIIDDRRITAEDQSKKGSGSSTEISGHGKETTLTAQTESDAVILVNDSGPATQTETQKVKKKKRKRAKNRFVIAPEFLREDFSSPVSYAQPREKPVRTSRKTLERAMQKRMDSEQKHEDKTVQSDVVRSMPDETANNELSPSTGDTSVFTFESPVKMMNTPCKKRLKTNPKSARTKSKLVQSLEAKCGMANMPQPIQPTNCIDNKRNTSAVSNADGQQRDKSKLRQPVEETTPQNPQGRNRCKSKDRGKEQGHGHVMSKSQISAESDTKMCPGSASKDINSEEPVQSNNACNPTKIVSYNTQKAPSTLNDILPIKIIHGKKNDLLCESMQHTKAGKKSADKKASCSNNKKSMVLFPLVSESGCGDGILAFQNDQKLSYSAVVKSSRPINDHGDLGTIDSTDSDDSADYIEMVQNFIEEENRNKSWRSAAAACSSSLADLPDNSSAAIRNGTSISDCLQDESIWFVPPTGQQDADFIQATNRSITGKIKSFQNYQLNIELCDQNGEVETNGEKSPYQQKVAEVNDLSMSPSEQISVFGCNTNFEELTEVKIRNEGTSAKESDNFQNNDFDNKDENCSLIIESSSTKDDDNFIPGFYDSNDGVGQNAIEIVPANIVVDEKEGETACEQEVNENPIKPVPPHVALPTTVPHSEAIGTNFQIHNRSESQTSYFNLAGLSSIDLKSESNISSLNGLSLPAGNEITATAADVSQAVLSTQLKSKNAITNISKSAPPIANAVESTLNTTNFGSYLHPPTGLPVPCLPALDKKVVQVPNSPTTYSSGFLVLSQIPSVSYSPVTLSSMKPSSSGSVPVLQDFIWPPESYKFTIGRYTFSCSQSLKVGKSSRDGVNVYIGLGLDYETVAVKRCLRQTSMVFTQNLAIINKTNLVKLLDLSLQYPSAIVIVNEWCDCNLKVYMTSDLYKQGGIAPRKTMCFELLSGLHALHSLNLAHSNLKPENVLMSKEGVLKISDYPVFSGWQDLMDQMPNQNPEKICWESTEQKKRVKARWPHRSDLQVAGMLLHYILCDGNHPYGVLSSPITVDSNIRAGLYSLHSTDLSARHLLSWMLHGDATLRKDTVTCMTHPYFWSKHQQVKFLAAIGCQEEIQTGYGPEVLSPINSLSWLNILDWRKQVEMDVFLLMAPNTYRETTGDLLKFISDISAMSNMPEDLQHVLGDTTTYIISRFSQYILPLYDVIIKSPLCLRHQVEEIIYQKMLSKQ